MADIRRLVALEARSGGASIAEVATKLANSMDSNAALERTYEPVDLDAVQLVDQVRITARNRSRQNKNGTKSLTVPAIRS